MQRNRIGTNFCFQVFVYWCTAYKSVCVTLDFTHKNVLDLCIDAIIQVSTAFTVEFNSALERKAMCKMHAWLVVKKR